MSAIKHYEWILFDWNGTLLNDVDYGIAVVNALCKTYSVPEISTEDYLRHFGFPLIDFYEKMGFDFTQYSFEELAEVFMQEYHKNLETVKLHDKVTDILDKLSNTYKLGIISAYKQSRLNEAVVHYNVKQYFDCIYGIADDRADSKSHSLREMIKTHAINPAKALIIGDTLHDFEVAQENGIDCILVEAGHQSHEQWENENITWISTLSKLTQNLEP